MQLDQWDPAVRGTKMSSTTGFTIFKYQMPVLERFTMKLPAFAQILRVDDENGMFWLWALVDTEAEDIERHFIAAFNPQVVIALLDELDAAAKSFFALGGNLAAEKARADAAEAERDELLAWSKTITTKLSDAIGLGSEMFRRHSEQYRIDPEFVATYIRDRRQSYHDTMHKHAEGRNRDRATIASLTEQLAEAREGWNPIATCPIREPVDLWCVYGGEEFAQYEGGASIGRLVPNRTKTKEYGFFGNQSDNGVPQRDAPDLVPVAWRKAVPSCPAALIAEALGIPVTLEDARATLSRLEKQEGEA